jgi:hypothetical protein
VVGKGKERLGLLSAGTVVTPAVGVGTKAFAQGEARDGVEGGDRAVFAVGGPKGMTALRAASSDRGKGLGLCGARPATSACHGSPSVCLSTSILPAFSTQVCQPRFFPSGHHSVRAPCRRDASPYFSVDLPALFLISPSSLSSHFFPRGAGPCHGRRSLAGVEGKRQGSEAPSRERFPAALLPPSPALQKYAGWKENEAAAEGTARRPGRRPEPARGGRSGRQGWRGVVPPSRFFCPS